MGTHFILVSTPILAYPTLFVEAGEPAGVQALRPELAVQRFNEGVVRRFARPAEVEDDAPTIGPEIKIFRDELGP